MPILVLGGGNSTERDVSLRSAKAVSDALRAAGFEVLNADPADGDDIFNDLPKDTIVFPIVHGNGEEDGTMQKRIEAKKLPFLGTPSQASAICFNKRKTRDVYQKYDLPIAKGFAVTKEEYERCELRNVSHVLKVSEGGSSIGTLIVHDPKKVTDAQINSVFDLGGEAIVEELVEGVEITVPVLDDKPLPVIEIKAPVGEEFDYLNKYNGASQEICPPVSINTELQRQAQAYALKAHSVLDCRHLSRTDIIVRPNGSMVLLETNTMPGMTSQSLFPIAAEAAGMPMPKLVTRFFELVKRDYNM